MNVLYTFGSVSFGLDSAAKLAKYLDHNVAAKFEADIHVDADGNGLPSWCKMHTTVLSGRQPKRTEKTMIWRIAMNSLLVVMGASNSVLPYTILKIPPMVSSCDGKSAGTESIMCWKRLPTISMIRLPSPVHGGDPRGKRRLPSFNWFALLIDCDVIFESIVKMPAFDRSTRIQIFRRRLAELACQPTRISLDFISWFFLAAILLRGSFDNTRVCRCYLNRTGG